MLILLVTVILIILFINSILLHVDISLFLILCLTILFSSVASAVFLVVRLSCGCLNSLWVVQLVLLSIQPQQKRRLFKFKAYF